MRYNFPLEIVVSNFGEYFRLPSALAEISLRRYGILRSCAPPFTQHAAHSIRFPRQAGARSTKTLCNSWGWQKWTTLEDLRA